MPRLSPGPSRELDIKMLARVASDQALAREYGLSSAAISKRRTKLTKLNPEALDLIKRDDLDLARKSKEERDSRRQEAIKTLLAAMTPYKRKLNRWTELSPQEQNKKPPLSTRETSALTRLLDVLFKETHQEEDAERDYQAWFNSQIQINFQNVNIVSIIDEIERILGPEQGQKLRDYYAKKPMETQAL